MTIHRTLHHLLAVAAMLACGAASAQGYVGAGVGPARIDIDCTGATSCDKSSTGFKIYGGWRLGAGWALEGAYFDWGKARASATDPELGTGTLKTKADGFGIGAAYHVPLAAVTCVGRLGIARNKAKTDVTLNGLSASDSYSGTFPYYGVGCGYPVAPGVVITGEADFSRVEYAPDEKASVRLFSLGVRWEF